MADTPNNNSGSAKAIIPLIILAVLVAVGWMFIQKPASESQTTPASSETAMTTEQPASIAPASGVVVPADTSATDTTQPIAPMGTAPEVVPPVTDSAVAPEATAPAVTGEEAPATTDAGEPAVTEGAEGAEAATPADSDGAATDATMAPVDAATGTTETAPATTETAPVPITPIAPPSATTP